MTDSYAYLGPRGTFTEAALLALDISNGADLVASATVPQALELVRNSQVKGALVPIENSVEGSVAATLDDLSHGTALEIVEEIAIPVTFSLLVRPATTLKSITRVATHPHAQAQCADWLRTNLPNAQILPAMSTASAAAGLGPEANYDAAISSTVAASHYGLEVLAENIGDNESAWTRFILVRQAGHVNPSTGNDKTTVSLFINDDHPGALLEILTEFAVRGVNLSRIESRPTKKQLGEYFFSIDFEGHIDDERVGEAMKGLHRICADVKFLGSYARHNGHATQVRKSVSDQAFSDADVWLSQLRDGKRS